MLNSYRNQMGILSLFFLFGCVSASGTSGLSEMELLSQLGQSSSDDQKIEAKLELAQRYAFMSDEALVAAILTNQATELKVFQYEALSNRLPAMPGEQLEKLSGHLSFPMQGKVERELNRRKPQPDPKKELIDQITVYTQPEPEKS